MKAQKGNAAVRVLGCKVNQAEAAALKSILQSQGYSFSEDDDPGLILVHTCCVTGKAEGKSRRLVKSISEKYPDAKLIVTGCLAEVNSDSIRKIAPNARILGTLAKENFLHLISNDFESELFSLPSVNCTHYGDLGIQSIPGRYRTYLKIQDGCSQGCAYCIVPIARGPSRSMDPSLVNEYFQKLAAEYPEIVVSGIHLGAYGQDLRDMNLSKLISMLAALDTGCRIRLSSIEPQEITPHLISAVSASPDLCPHFHIPLQSGDNKILSRMLRPYTSESVLDLTTLLKSKMPDVCIGFDVMVGFPGEDDYSFEKTLQLIKQIEPAYLHVFPFSPRPGTLASELRPRVPAKTAALRVKLLRELSDEMRERFYVGFEGEKLDAVLESVSSESGSAVVRTANYIPVQLRNFSGKEKRISVKIEKVRAGIVFGSQLNDRFF